MPQGGRGQDMSFRFLGVFRFRAGNFFDAEKVTKKAPRDFAPWVSPYLFYDAASR